MIFDRHRLHRQVHHDDDYESLFVPFVVGLMSVLVVWSLLYILLS